MAVEEQRHSSYRDNTSVPLSASVNFHGFKLKLNLSTASVKGSVGSTTQSNKEAVTYRVIFASLNVKRISRCPNDEPVLRVHS